MALFRVGMRLLLESKQQKELPLDSCACHALHKSPHLGSAIHIIDNIDFYHYYDNLLTNVKDVRKGHGVLICLKTLSKHSMDRNRQQI